MAFYDLEGFKARAAAGPPEVMQKAGLRPIDDLHNDVDWLEWSMDWVFRLLTR